MEVVSFYRPDHDTSQVLSLSKLNFVGEGFDVIITNPLVALEGVRGKLVFPPYFSPSTFRFLDAQLNIDFVIVCP